MLGTKRKLQFLAASAFLLTLAPSLGCSGFFHNPTLIKITVTPPAPMIPQGDTLQMAANGTYDHGPPNILVDAIWTTDKDTVATVSSTGLVLGISPGTAKITATSASGEVSGSTTVTVTPKP